MRIDPIAAALSLVLAGCGGSSQPATGQGAPGAQGGSAGPKLGKTLPKVVNPSGVKDDWRKVRDLEDAVKSSRKEDEQAAAKKALADFLAEFPARYEGKTVEAPESCYYAVVLQKCKQYSKAVDECRRYIEAASPDSPNYLNCHTCLISSLAQSGDFDGAESELKAVQDTVYKDRVRERQSVEETIANCMLKGGRVELAGDHFRALAEANVDFDSAKMAVDCFLRQGKLDDAKRLAGRMTDLIKDGKNMEFAKWLAQQVDLIGRPAPGFAGAKWWKGVGGPIADADLQGKVTVVFVWNMQSQWDKFMFERLGSMIKDLADKPLQVVGLSRLAHYDPFTGATKADMPEETELECYEKWKEQYEITYPLAVDSFESEALLGPWVGHTVPYFVVVGKDGKVAYVRSGKAEEHFAALKEMVEKALAK